jgi:putative FmdB family regulatory protein
MPIYEFYCPECHMIYSFLAKSVNTDKRPSCPKCGRRRLRRQVSAFAVSGGQEDEEGMDDLPVDEARMERALSSLADEAEGINEDDPKQAAKLMRKLSGEMGVEYGESMEEALHRMEAGEDPEAIEAEMGDALDSEEEPFILKEQKRKKEQRLKRRAEPGKDPNLYEM